MELSHLPDFPAIKALAKALWRDGESRGAALLVGAGFSRFAQLPAGVSRKAPLWKDLRDDMVSQIYSGVSDRDIPADPLRLAEEYRAMLGQLALDDFIRSKVPDAGWAPGAMHEKLLALPWSDVLTTNWDTLLERTTDRLDDVSLEPVLTEGDLARARAPRIIKLHGTLPSGPFIFTEEDYRSYPVKHAAFVNLARQVFLENELCLVGFSGNDPNFLQWSGWVRDHLGDGARRIYLVGALNLQPATRRLLEQRNIAPVDLWPLVAGKHVADRHAEATRLFLEYLKASEPQPATKWILDTAGRPSSADSESARNDKAVAARALETVVQSWREERLAYPGWLVCPFQSRSDLKHATDRYWIFTPVLEALSPQMKPRVLFELAWRFDKAYWPMPPEMFSVLLGCINVLTIESITSPVDGNALTLDEYLDLLVIALRSARQLGDQAAHGAVVARIEEYAEPESDHRAEVAYQRCLSDLAKLNYAEVFKNVSKIRGPDPVWKLRQAGVRCELAETNEARRLVLEAEAELIARQRLDRKSLWLMSRRAWAEMMARSAELGMFDSKTRSRLGDTSAGYKAAKCDPWEELRHVEDVVDKATAEAENPFDAKPAFDAGVYRPAGAPRRFRSWTVSNPIHEFDRIVLDSGIPVSFGMASVRDALTKDALAVAYEPTLDWYLKLFQVLHKHQDELLDRFVDRVSIAKLPFDVIKGLFDRCNEAVAVWRQRTFDVARDGGERRYSSQAIEKIRFLIEVKSRLVIRCPEEEAYDAFLAALDLLNDPDLDHWWLWEPIGHLLRRSAEVLSREKRGELALRTLAFPLAKPENGISSDWPRPFDYVQSGTIRRSTDEVAWALRIKVLIEAAGRLDGSRQEAVSRLVALHDKALLTEDERKEFGAALHAHVGEDGWPAGTNFHVFAFLGLPSPDHDADRSRFAAQLYSIAAGDRLDASRLLSIKAAARGGDKLYPSRSEATVLLDAILAWRPVKSDPFFDIEGAKSRQIAREIGPCLAHAILPALEASDVTQDRIDGLFALMSDVPAPSVLQVLPLLLPHRPDLHDRIVLAIRTALISTDPQGVSGAVSAIDQWPSGPGMPELPTGLVDRLVWTIGARIEIGLTALIWCANRLTIKGKLSVTQRARLTEALDELYVVTQYDRAIPQPLRILFSLVRAHCVRLATTLAKEGQGGQGINVWLDAYPHDPLPEVRHALSDEDGA